MHKQQSVQIRNRNGKVSAKSNIIKNYKNRMSDLMRNKKMFLYINFIEMYIMPIFYIKKQPIQR